MPYFRPLLASRLTVRARCAERTGARQGRAPLRGADPGSPLLCVAAGVPCVPPKLPCAMAGEWRDAVLLPAGSEIPEDARADERERGRGFFARLRESLRRTREALAGELGASVIGRVDDGVFERIEEALIRADLGVPATARIVGQLEEEVALGRIEGREQLVARLRELIAQAARPDGSEARLDLRARPAVVMVVGVNGTGKTTTIGKLAAALRGDLGLRVLVAAADTYRAAAVEQLAAWAERADTEIVRGQPGQDPGSVAFDALEAAQARGVDVVLIDTAGRLHNRTPLMEELAKVGRVVSGKVAGAPHETLLVIDATTGQNGLRQASAFAQKTPVTGIVLTKLDGSAKGGVVVAIAQELGLPIKLVGVGEGIADLRPFDPEAFAAALVE
ncbi:fused signal recognition particle receptor [Thermoleophilum album]|uniref:Signal recognition particle receptor FtsY n=2 Tax=Thermoleophilum album TaxID=29539 RepID=A0A1H6FZF9_THEAL|nr:fused signal recognition particle receptor [Thermoleophilum album]